MFIVRRNADGTLPPLPKPAVSPMRLASNLRGSAWIHDRLHPFGQDVGAVVPTGFETYARIFHPPYRLEAVGTLTPIRWRDIAAANGRTIEAELQRVDVSSLPSEADSSGEKLWDQQPYCGSLPPELAARLVSTLRAHTVTPDACWFACWEGFGGLQERLLDAPVLRIPARDFRLLNGRLDDVLETLNGVEWSYQSPNLWWPEDRAWCVATEIDFTWTYVGGSRACVEEILKDPMLEALPTHPSEGNTMLT